MIPKIKHACFSWRSIPRESGDDPRVAVAFLRRAAVFPARAGMIPELRYARETHPRIPRESGDDPYLQETYGVVISYSPRERG